MATKVPVHAPRATGPRRISDRDVRARLTARRRCRIVAAVIAIARYVALGDSSTEGLDDPDGEGGYRGWADRFAERIAEHHPGLAYANLAVRGRTTREIREQQLPPARAMRPDVATVVAGMNDLLRGGFDPRAIADDLGAMQAALRADGAFVISFTIPDLAHRLFVGPVARRMSARTQALNVELRAVSAATGAHLIDLAAHAITADPRMWSRDRLHASPAGHARVAEALAHAIGLPDATDAWRVPLPPAPPTPPAARLREHAAWMRDYFAPWLWRRARGRTTGDGRAAKRPTLAPVRHPGARHR